MNHRSKPIQFPQMLATIVCAAVVLLCGAPVIAQDAPPPSPAPLEGEGNGLSEDQQRELDLLLFVLNSANTDLAKRRDAAVTLIRRAWPPAIDALTAALQKPQDAAQTRAIAQAVALIGSPPTELADPLIGQLAEAEAALREDLTAALSRYDNAGVTPKLAELAGEADLPPSQRVGAIAALAEHRQAQAIQTLIELTQSRQPEAVRRASFAALQRLTGIAEHGQDAAAWRQWWAAHRDLPRDRWLARLVRSLSQDNRRLADEKARLTGRLAETYNQLYLATDEDQRPALLIDMLDDEQVAVRMLSLGLIERKVLNAQPVPDAVREAMRQRIADASPKVRAKVIGLLRDLDDKPAVPLVVERLANETDSAARDAALSLLARQPSGAAIGPALAMLADGASVEAAARLLSSAVAANLAGEPQLTGIRKAVRDHLARPAPAPEVVRLLGAVAAPADAARLAKLLDHEQAPVRLAAADAYMAAGFELAGLLKYLGDPALSSKAIEAAARRGDSVEMAVKLLGHEPDEADPRQRWRDAIIAIAGRLDAEALVRLDTALGTDAGRRPLRLAVLGAAKAINDGKPHKAAALLTLAELQLQADRLDELGQTLKTLDAIELTHQQKPRHQMLRLDHAIATDQYEAAMTQAKRLVGERSAEPAAVVNRLLGAAERALAQKKTEQAGALIAGVPQLHEQALSDDAGARLESLKQKLAEMQNPPPPDDG